MRAKPRPGPYNGGRRIDNLPPCVMTIAAVAVGLGPGSRSFRPAPQAWLLHRALGPRPKAAPKHSREAQHRELARVAAPQFVTGQAIWLTGEPGPEHQPRLCILD